MSNLYRSAISARLAKLPAELPATENNDDDEESEAADSVGSLGMGTGMGPPAIPRRSLPALSKKPKRAPNANFSQISASGFFAEAAQVSVSSRNLDCRIYYTPPKFSDGSVMICHHGAGYSGLSFACFAKEVSDMTKGECGVLAFDARRHGKTTSKAGSDDGDLSIETLTADFVDLINNIFPQPAQAPTFILVGHSMGGSVLVHACPILLDKQYRVGGVAVLDVVEGSALEALPHMHSLLNARPDGFESVEDAVEWHVTTNTIRNMNSARVSIPSIVKEGTSSAATPAYQWRTPLRSTAPYWPSWFTGLSKSFLAVRTARLLILAGTDRLDRELMIGQMQGKFQMIVVPAVGHMLHEDDPTTLAGTLVDFWRRNERVVTGIKKVGEL